MRPHDTEIQCTACENATIIAEVEFFWPKDVEVPIGPASVDYSQIKIVSLRCPACSTTYSDLPGNPNVASQILQNIRQWEEDRF